MSKSVTWRYLSAEQVHRALTSAEKRDIVDCIKEASASNAAAFKLLRSPSGHPYTLTHEQEAILLDLYVQLIRFCQGIGFGPEKASTLVGIVAETHDSSMSGRLTHAQAYKDFEERLVAHSVHRPPYCAQIFSLHDASYVTDYMLQTYYRHYKLYLYTFTPREIAVVRTVSLAVQHNVPPVSVPPMAKSVPLAQWEAHQDELRKAEEDRLQRIADEEAAAKAEAERLAFEADRPPMTSSLKQQLDYIRHTVGKMSKEKLDDLETKLVSLEQRVAEVNKPLSATGVRPPVKPPSKK